MSTITRLPDLVSPRLSPNFAPQLAGTGPWPPELLELFALINGMLTCAEIEAGSATTSVVATYQPVLVNAIVGIRNRHLPGCLVNE